MDRAAAHAAARASKPRRDPSIPRLLARGAVKHCPRCGHRNLFRRWFTMLPSCPGCALPFDREPGWVLGAMTINTAWTFVAILVTMLAGFVLTYPDIDALVVSVVTGAVAVLTPMVGYPFSKTVWIAVDLAMVPDRPQQIAAREEGAAGSQPSDGAGDDRSNSRST